MSGASRQGDVGRDVVGRAEIEVAEALIRAVSARSRNLRDRLELGTHIINETEVAVRAAVVAQWSETIRR